MKRSFSKPGQREKTDKTEKKVSLPAVSRKEKSSKRRLSIYDEFEEDEWDEPVPKNNKLLKAGKSRV